LKNFSWYFANFESAEGSALAERIFSEDEVETVLVLENHLVVTRKDKTLYDWKEFAKAIGCFIRSAIDENGEQLISAKILESIPSEDAIRSGIQKSIDDEVNPGVAGHGGMISLLNVRGNTITIHMGGGCQGCSAADLTLKQGIHTTFRKAMPQVGAILDETDHSAGLNPYFS
jgi:Fe-S cluster biogenesis protein NfuA